LRFTLQDLKKSKVAEINRHVLEVDERKKKQKHNNVIIEFDGFSFRSKRECGRYITLRAKQTFGEISDLQLQVPFELNDGGTHSLTYVSDFCYKDKSGQIIVEDCKGQRTRLFEKKANLMKKIHGIDIRLS